MIFSILCSLLLLITPSSHTADQPNVFGETNFQNPPLAYRPLQIIHGFDNILSSKYPNRALDHDFLAELIEASSKESSPYPDLKQSLKAVLQEFQEDGLGGVVCNVSFRDYMRDENQWTLFQWGIQACKEVGLRVWIYDEEGYPSGSAGGLVLEKNASYEAQELILDPTSETKYQIRPSYEGTHASNNFHVARRYPNLIDREADQAFIQITHDAYAKIVGGEFGKMIEAFFTDEPSMMACTWDRFPKKPEKTFRFMILSIRICNGFPPYPGFMICLNDFRKNMDMQFSLISNLSSGEIEWRIRKSEPISGRSFPNSSRRATSALFRNGVRNMPSLPADIFCGKNRCSIILP